MGRIDEDRRSSGGRRFRIQYRLGSGGFGDVYRASMIGVGGIETEVALKMLQGRDATSQVAIERLRDEARMLATLNHPSILRVYDLVTLSGQLTLVTEYIRGADLSRCLSPMPLSASLEALAQVADGLAAAWSTPSPTEGRPLGLLHRDIKPSNIRISQHGQTKILDFGIATMGGAVTQPGATAAPVGSAPYMAPERFEGAGDTTASDVFSLGCILYEALADKRLYGVHSATQLYLQALSPERHAEHTRNQLNALGDVRPELAQLLVEMLAYDESQRPAIDGLSERFLGLKPDGPSLRSWARERSWSEDEASAGALGGQVISARTASVPDTPARNLPSPVGARLLGVAIVAVGLALGVAAGVLWTREEAPPPRPKTQVQVPSERSPAPDESPAPITAPSPPADAPSPSPTGSVQISGDHTEVALVDIHGHRRAPGRVPPGTYEIVASFPEVGEQRAGEITVEAGGVYSLRCAARFYSCK